MVFYYKARPDAGDYTIYMGADKNENEELIKYGLPEDVWYVRTCILRTRTVVARRRSSRSGIAHLRLRFARVHTYDRLVARVGSRSAAT
jgi:hypothetical protein